MTDSDRPHEEVGEDVRSETDSLLDTAAVVVPFSNDDDDEESDDDDDSTQEEDDESSSIWNDLLSASWREHSVAIGVAILATLVAYYFQYHHRNTTTLTTEDPSLGRRRELFLQQAQDSYLRTANISFCGDEDSMVVPKGMERMEFRVPRELLGTLHKIYQQEGQPFPSCLLQELSTTTSPTAAASAVPSNSNNSPIIGSTLFYNSPTIASMYPHHPSPSSNDHRRALQAAALSFTGLAAQFFNLSPDPVLLYWDAHEDRTLVGEVWSMKSITTATFVGESFSISPVHDSSTALERWVVTMEHAVHYYEDARSVERIYKNDDMAFRYEWALLNKAFALDYLMYARRTWWSAFPRRQDLPPMRPATYIGQRHTVKYIDSNKKHFYELRVASVTPRVFTIDNFLSPDECQALIDAAKKETFTPSTVYSSGDEQDPYARSQPIARSSSTAWLANSSPLTRSIYNRTAKLLGLDNADASWNHRVESLQVVQYNTSQHYAPHHDWIVPADMTHPTQPTRYATLVLYLNDNFTGGRTHFPRAVTKDAHDGVYITPQQGRAVLFYNLLPDGNMDDNSQHGAEIVTAGIKYSANVWVWDPYVV